MAKVSKNKKGAVVHPTVGPAFKTGKAVVQIFEAWLPLDWLARSEDPDFHVDYTVETVENGEPTARHFRAQVKGRTAKLKDGKVKESLKTKHLRYYAKSPLPVFIFRIDPETGAGHWLFIQRYIKENKLAAKFDKQTKLTIEFDPAWDLNAKDLFLKEVHEAFTFMADQFPGSPQAAIAARKMMLEAVDPNAQISIQATDKAVNYVIATKETALISPVVAGGFTEEVWQALQSGKPVSLKASELTATAPIIRHLLAEAGDKEITIGLALPKQPGSAQISMGADEFGFLQVDGEWTASPTRLSFAGELAGSPFHVTSVWTGKDPAHFGIPDVTFGYKISKWAGQPLLNLAHFDDLTRLFQDKPMRMRFLARGQEMYRGTISNPGLLTDQWLAKSMEWIGKLRQTGLFFGQNPLFPQQGDLSKLETPHVRVLVALATTGKCIEKFSGDTFKATGRFPGKFEPHPTELGWMKFWDQYKEFDFLGNRINVGPFSYTWSDIILLKVADRPDGQRVLTWKGGENAKLTTELQARQSGASDLG